MFEPEIRPKTKLTSLRRFLPACIQEEDDDFNDKGFEKRGVMKARSISNLLSQTVPKYTNTQGNALTI